MQSHRTGRIFCPIAQRRNQPMSELTNVRMPLGLFSYLSVCSCRPSAVKPDRWSCIGSYGKKILVVSLLPEMAVVLLEWRRLVFLLLKKSSRKPQLCIQATGRIARLYAAVEIGSPAIRPKADFYVHQNIARCVQSYSISFGLLPKALS